MNSKTPKIKEIISKIDMSKIADYSVKYPKSSTLKEIIKYSRKALDSDEEEKVFKLGVKIAYDLDTMCDINKTGDYVKDETEKKYWLEISEELFKNTIGSKK